MIVAMKRLIQVTRSLLSPAKQRRERDAKHVGQNQADDHAEVDGRDRVELLAADGAIGHEHAAGNQQHAKKAGPRQPAHCRPPASSDCDSWNPSAIATARNTQRRMSKAIANYHELCASHADRRSSPFHSNSRPPSHQGGRRSTSGHRAAQPAMLFEGEAVGHAGQVICDGSGRAVGWRLGAEFGRQPVGIGDQNRRTSRGAPAGPRRASLRPFGWR